MLMKDIYEIKYHAVGYDKLSNRQHTHTGSHELLLCHSDGGTMLINDNIFPIKKNTLFIINADYIHCSNPSDAVSYERSAVLFNTNYMRSVLGVLGITDMLGGLIPSRGGIRLLLGSDTGEFVNDCFNRMNIAALGKSPYKRAEITNLILTVMFRIVSEKELSMPGIDVQNDRSGTYGSQLILQILEFINLNLPYDVSADRIAEKIGINRSYLCRLFRRKTTMTLTQYVTEQRLSLSRSMLLQTEHSVLEIALSCGFGSPSYFCRLFRDTYGVSPLAFRQNNRGHNMIIPNAADPSSSNVQCKDMKSN